MYYPYLRARQFELIALRELTSEGILKGVITPILEPIKESMNAMDLALRVFKEWSQPVYLVANPTVGECKGNQLRFIEYIIEQDPAGNVLRPAFHCTPESVNYIANSIARYGLQECMLICGNDLTPELVGFDAILNSAAVTKIVIAEPEGNRTFTRELRRTNKAMIRFDDKFEALPRNQDYLPVGEHLFSEEHAFYKEDKFQGFSDFTILSSDFMEGGGPPRAVVIHLTYFKNDAQIWMRHFTSESNDSTSDVQGKFGEAARKAVAFCHAVGHRNSAIEELAQFVAEERYPGLGTVKKISIKNHLLILSQYLRQHAT